MYVDPFFAGVVTTILVEVILFIGVAIFTGNKKN